MTAAAVVLDDAVAGCMPCQLESATQESIVFRDETWSCEIAPNNEVPGWFILRLRRHAEGWNELTPAELADFGNRSQNLSNAMMSSLNASHVYFMSFGENYAHFHFLVIGRDAHTPAELRGANILKLRHTELDVAAAKAVIPGLRAALATSRTPSERHTP